MARMLLGCADGRVLGTLLELRTQYDPGADNPGDVIYLLTRFGAARDLADHHTRDSALDALEVGLLDVELIVLVEHDGSLTLPDGTKSQPGCAEYAFRYGDADRRLEPLVEDGLHLTTLVLAVRALRERIDRLYREGKRRNDPANVRLVTLIDHHRDGVEEIDVAQVARELGLHSTGRCD